MTYKNIQDIKTLNELETYRTELNKALNKRAERISLCNEAAELAEKPFGYIKEAFEAISPILFSSKEGKNTINKYTKAIRENKSLSSMHTLCENIRKAGKNTDSSFFFNAISNSNWDVKKGELDEATRQLGRILAEGYIIAGQEAKNVLPKENIKLNAAISYIAENKLGKNNIADFADAFNIIKEEALSKESPSNISESTDLDKLAKSLISEFNAKYSSSLTQEEMTALKEISSSQNREEIFNKYKQACADKISEAKANFIQKGDKESSERLMTVIEQVEKKAYSVDTLGKDICSLIELSNIFE